jgi:hypothetical protein
MFFACRVALLLALYAKPSYNISKGILEEAGMKPAEKLMEQEGNGKTRKDGMLLDDAELEQVSGGIEFFRNCFTCISNYDYGGRACQGCPAYRGEQDHQ